MTIRLYENNTQEESNRAGVWANSLDISDGAHFLLSTGNVVGKATTWARIVWVNNTETTYASDNQSSAKKEVTYVPETANRLYEVDVAGQLITFSGALVGSNTIDLNVNGVAMDTVTYASHDTNTLGLIATELETFAEIESAVVGTNSIVVTWVDANSTVVISDIVVLLWDSQVTAVVTDAGIAVWDETKYYDLVSSFAIKASTASATTGQVQLVKYISVIKWVFKIVNK